ncbi:Piriformospora indica-insensitive protein 2, partial [Cucurbita argyrosperma subsp. argyrosperma]
MASFTLLLLAFLLSTNSFAAEEMEEEELLALFEVMGSLLDYPDWPQAHPFPCTDTPWPGVKCEICQAPPFFHVTQIHIGPDILDPPCKISANLSHALLNLPYLKSLSIFSCFTASPAALFPALFESLSYLEHLALQSNPALSGVIPSSLGNAGSLRVLSLSQNSLNGEIPQAIGGLVHLQQLDLSYNNLSGEVPQAIGGLKSLSILDLSWNALKGQLPSSLGNLQLLQKLDLGSNKLQGKIPQKLGMLKKLVLLDLSHNFINGPIPESFGGLEHLEYLILDHNPLNAAVPLFLGSLEKLTSVSLSECGIEGPIPTSLTSLKTLTALSLANNNLSGPIPPELGELPNLDLLNLSHNQLSGELSFPNEFMNKLGKRLDLRGNYGLCSGQRRNFSVHSDEPPYCLNGARNESEKQERTEDYKSIQPAWNQWEDNSCSSTNLSWDKDLMLVFCAFVVAVVLCSVLLE